jgi:alpha-beta hydrolase superfamily lysophospholipase
MTTSSLPSPIVSVKPVVLPAPGRGEDLQVRVSAPVAGHDLPVILFSHGFGWSMDGYAPLADAWAARGFVVIQPTYLDSRRLGLAADDPRTPGIWRRRVQDATHALDELDRIAAAVPGDHDVSPLLTTRGWDWATDPYALSPSPKSLLTLFAAEHSLGGIPGYEVAETTDESPQRVALLQELTTAYLRTALDPRDESWPAARAALRESADPLGRIEER